MSPQWPQQTAHTNADAMLVELGKRTETLLRRLQDIELALAVKEWWMLGRALPTARLLAEIASLLAVARGELESVLVQVFGKDVPTREQTDNFAAISTEPPGAEHDPAWLAAANDQSLALLRMVASSLPAMIQYAEMLMSYGEHMGAGHAATDAYGVVLSRFHEVYDALREPPR